MSPEERRRRNTLYQAAKRRAASKVETQFERQERCRREADRKRELRNKARAKETAREREHRLKLAAEAERKHRQQRPRAIETRKQEEEVTISGGARVHNTAQQCRNFIRSQSTTTEPQSCRLPSKSIEKGCLVGVLYDRDAKNNYVLYLADKGDDRYLNICGLYSAIEKSCPHKPYSWEKYEIHGPPPRPANGIKMSAMSFLRKVEVQGHVLGWCWPSQNIGSSVTIKAASNHHLCGDQPSFRACSYSIVSTNEDWEPQNHTTHTDATTTNRHHKAFWIKR